MDIGSGVERSSIQKVGFLLRTVYYLLYINCSERKFSLSLGYVRFLLASEVRVSKNKHRYNVGARQPCADLEQPKEKNILT